ncbi:cyclopropane fatty acyl phospholipid synthase [Lysobacter sp. SG-8]|uniref:Cyclopropane fatty acyl phospholipid synthase n=1 Tax=Marilutibacter penaei TaxID=2759900 RepID=A0A7W3YFF3_9GAMM|nr:cyclopropane fatty acyl phospholipid synthase [Lysobacter penaei]MBB1089147.1 cyclopropane fatty acyl phospholipid synthase [Lysobacter penaei]
MGTANDWAREKVLELLEQAGVRVVEGDAPASADGRGDLHVHHPRFYRRVLAQGSLGLGDAYMDGWWDAPSLDGLLTRVLGMHVDERAGRWPARLEEWRARWLNRQTRRRSRAVGERHYDLGNDLYRAMLGARLVYSCGYWRDAKDLDAAQDAKLDLVCRKLGLRPGMRVLDIGCGWGEALAFAHAHYGVEGVGVTISAEQAAFARRLCEGRPIEIRLQDYRDVDERFDRILSIGMFEHVGHANYAAFMDVARRCLPDDGLCLLHTIGRNLTTHSTDPWIARHIFPNSMLPSPVQIAQAVEGRFVIEDWHNFGADYDLTLRAWRDNIEAAWDSLPSRYDERFRRMWRFYLAGSMAVFRTRRAQLWQVVLSPRGVPGGYVAPR